MNTQQHKNIWIIIGHPRQLAMALVLTKYFSSQFPCHLLISRHKYYKTINLEEFRGSFKSITQFEPIYHTHTIKDLFKMIIKFFKTKNAIRQLPVKPDDVLISLEVWNYIENLMTTVWRKNKQILLYPERIRSYISFSHREIYSQKNRYVTKAGYVHFFLDKLLGLKKQYFQYWLRDGFPRFNHGLAYTLPVEKFYDRVFVYKSIFSKYLEDNEIYYPYYSLRTTSHNPEERKMVVFFTSGYVTNKAYNKKLSQILQNLRQHYDGQYGLHLRLHPNQPETDKVIDCNGWHINRETGNAQIFITRHADKISAVFSDKSTMLSFPLNMCLPTYSYHRAMGLAPYVVDGIDKTYQDAPKEFFLETLDAIPQDYEPVKDGLAKAQTSLNKIFNEIS